MADIEVVHVNESFVQINAERPYLKEIAQEFSFYAKNYVFHPRYKAKMWDGKISLFKTSTRMLPKGLLSRLDTWGEHNKRSIAYDQRVLETLSPFEVDDEDILTLYKKIDGPFEPLDTQIDAVSHCINNGRAVILSPTSNGKSYMMHGLAAFFAMQKKRVLIIIDRSQLVEQLKENMRDEYLGGQKFRIHSVYENPDINQTDIYVTTWQSCYEMPEKWFQQFDVLIGDELHKFKANSIQMINDKIGHISWRFGFTATLDNGSVTDRLTIIGMFGPTHRVATIKELIELGISARPTIYMVRLVYPEHECVNIRGLDYRDESRYLERHEKRNRIIQSFVPKLPGNRLVAFKSHDHGMTLVEMIKEVNDGKAPFFADYTVSKERRIAISKQIDLMDDAIGVVSLGTFSTGINIKKVNSLLITCLFKSAITVPQLIGRTLRVTKTKTSSTIIDIGDDMRSCVQGNQYDNISYRHFMERKKIYENDGFEVIEKTIYVD